MKKNLVLLLVVTLCLPLFVFAADTCDSSKVYVSSINTEESFQNIVESEDANIIGNNSIELNLRFFEVGDGILYSFTVKNESNNDFELDPNDFDIDSQYITFTLSTDDDNMVVKRDSEKTFYLKAMYEQPVPDNAFDNGVFNDTNSFLLNLSNDSLSNNPKTGNTSIIILMIFILLFIVISLFHMKKKSSFVLLLGLLLLVPGAVYALCSLNVEVSTNYAISRLPQFCVDSCVNTGEVEALARTTCNTNYYEYEEGMTFGEYLDSDLNFNNLMINDKSGNSRFIIPTFNQNYGECYSIFDADSGQAITESTLIQNDECYRYYHGYTCQYLQIS